MLKKKKTQYEVELLYLITDQVFYSHENKTTYYYSDFLKTISDKRHPRNMYRGSFITDCLRQEVTYLNKNENKRPIPLIVTYASCGQKASEYILHTADKFGLKRVFLSRVTGFNTEYDFPMITVVHLDDSFEYVFHFYGQVIISEFYDTHNLDVFASFEKRCHQLLGTPYKCEVLPPGKDLAGLNEIWSSTSKLSVWSISDTELEGDYMEHYSIDDYCIGLMEQLSLEPIEF